MRKRRPVDLEELLARCPFPGSCSPVEPAADLWLLHRERGEQPELHRHDHRRCISTWTAWWHPDDPPLQHHREPSLYLAARHLPEVTWSAGWQRLVVSLLSCRAQPRQHLADAERLLNVVRHPSHLVTADLEALLSATGARQARPLRHLGEHWPADGTWPESIRGWLGVGHQVSEVYQLTVWGRTPDEPGWVSPMLTLTDAMGLVPWVRARPPAW